MTSNIKGDYDSISSHNTYAQYQNEIAKHPLDDAGAALVSRSQIHATTIEPSFFDLAWGLSQKKSIVATEAPPNYTSQLLRNPRVFGEFALLESQKEVVLNAGGSDPTTTAIVDCVTSLAHFLKETTFATCKMCSVMKT